MKQLFFLFILLSFIHFSFFNDPVYPSFNKFIRIFDGRTFKGWEGDTIKTFRIGNNSIVGGSLVETVPHNEFLCTTESYNNFILKLKFKLTGSGFVNAGVQFRSKRTANPAYEMVGYQADLGEGYWASLYDESRRNITLAKPDSVRLNKILKEMIGITMRLFVRVRTYASD